MTQPNSTRSILLVDDDTSFRKILETSLTKAGYKVIATSGRSEILAVLESKRFDLVVTDVLMPEIDGTEVIKLVRELQPAAAIIAMTGGGYRMSPELLLTVATAMGARVPLEKPFGADVFLKAVALALADRDSSVLS
jgi:DNA-binding NtrC family response regulator